MLRTHSEDILEIGGGGSGPHPLFPGRLSLGCVTPITSGLTRVQI